MPFEILFSDKARKDIKNLDKSMLQRIAKKIDELKMQETPYMEKLRGFDFYKVRVGKYRIIIDKYPATKTLVILRIEDREKVYKRNF